MKRKRPCVNVGKSRKRQPPALTLLEAVEAAGFVPEQITKRMQQGATYHEALMDLIQRWPDSIHLCRRLETWLSRQTLDEKQRAAIDTAPLPSKRVLVVSVRQMRMPETDCFIFDTVEKMSEAVVEMLKPIKRVHVELFSVGERLGDVTKEFISQCMNESQGDGFRIWFGQFFSEDGQSMLTVHWQTIK